MTSYLFIILIYSDYWSIGIHRNGEDLLHWSRICQQAHYGCYSTKCLHIEVAVVDISVPCISAGNNDQLPIYEPGLNDVVKQWRGKNLFSSTDVEKHVCEADIVFVSVNTSTKTRGLGAGKAADLTYWESAARMIDDVSKSDKIVVEKSTVPVKTVNIVSLVGFLFCLVF
ncbi:putative UDP-glucose 6-dehydrogenase [Helianthus annuus]|nr:putative UDP-glucose 6-dehydrogenase [Helianthus annuus]KAJ0942000.1 putative UDP-glucose 6-dehydrogenase [Helianthus annuus]